MTEAPKLNHTDSSLRLRVHLVFGVGVVERRRERVDRLELERQLAIGALALDAVEAVAQVLRHRIDVGRRSGRLVMFCERRAPGADRAPVVLVAAERTPAIAHRRLVEPSCAFLVAGRQRDAPAIVRKVLLKMPEISGVTESPWMLPGRLSADWSMTPFTPKLS